MNVLVVVIIKLATTHYTGIIHVAVGCMIGRSCSLFGKQRTGIKTLTALDATVAAAVRARLGRWFDSILVALRGAGDENGGRSVGGVGGDGDIWSV